MPFLSKMVAELIPAHRMSLCLIFTVWNTPSFKYVKDLAKQIIDKKISLKNIGAKSDEEIIDTLTKVKGIGPWTTHMFLMFVLGRKNILPTGDLGIKKAIMLNYNLKNLPTGEDISKLSKKNNWNPYNTYACMYLWKSIDGE